MFVSYATQAAELPHRRWNEGGALRKLSSGYVWVSPCPSGNAIVDHMKEAFSRVLGVPVYRRRPRQSFREEEPPMKNLPVAGRGSLADRTRLGWRPIFAAWVVFAFILFKRSAAVCIRIPPLYGGELAILVFTILFLQRATAARFFKNPFGVIVAIYLLVAIPMMVAAYLDVGFQFAIHGATAYYAVFVYFGYAALFSRASQSYFIRTLYFVLVVSGVLTVLWSIPSIQPLVPRIGEVPIFGAGGGGYVFTTLGFAYVVIYGRELGYAKSVLLLLLSCLRYFMAFQRGCMLATVGVFALLVHQRRTWSYRPWKPWRVLAMIALGSLVVGSVLIAPSSTFSDHVLSQGTAALSIIGKSDFRSGSRDHRLEMWQRVAEETISRDPWFGRGFREPLIEETFRSPHNCFVEIFGYMGIFGLVPALALYVLFPAMVFMQLVSRRHRPLEKDTLFYMCYAISFYGAAFFAPTLVSPYSALVSNFFFGAFLRHAEVTGLASPFQERPWHARFIPRPNRPQNTCCSR